ncbi:MAG: hypothetical protein A2651_01620 [Candidatus Yanofskybacteria bacterium RIFCSPHIGHO2_01_FULL_42_12]|uniref:Uncharacterized protein n=1 Tax=Candidatus Harrisonbacteria bacterium RIFCSPLOWO2_02_FULL_45_10c TaxID=1798410 RepID=A0A1G1ZUG9_9BACT|nr:MAG: hypothetical protein A2651_01620 [Candidatus Yanofskybacteria bacterium RIFCSPHIGHO2_01_FULL_42_12]OGY68368.1 MAG: hypothetical protein A3H63_00990 [Candidatus Harrisonbacteria bacterium RIFCSPLOWO2_02_FULL_45_10c]
MLYWFRRFLSDKIIQDIYVSAGLEVAEAFILIPEAGLCYDYELRLSCWKKWESLYVERGYRTIPIETFIKHAYDAQPIAGLGIKRQEGENLIFFAPLASDRIRQYNTLIQKEIRKQINL